MNKIFQLPRISRPHSIVPGIMSEKQIDLHHGVHHRQYVEKANGFIERGRFKAADLVLYLSHNDRGEVYNQVAQAWNHTFFWLSLGMLPAPETSRIETKKIERTLSPLRSEWIRQAEAHFGSGWLWLVRDYGGTFKVVTTRDAATPLHSFQLPLLVLDLWEHSYYLDYQSDRKSYASACWDRLNWSWAHAILHDPMSLHHVEDLLTKERKNAYTAPAPYFPRPSAPTLFFPPLTL